jgi:hypothetical protein
MISEAFAYTPLGKPENKFSSSLAPFDINITAINSLFTCPRALNLFEPYAKYFVFEGEDVKDTLERIISDPKVHFYCIFKSGVLEGLVWVYDFRGCTAEISAICARGDATRYTKQVLNEIMGYYPDVVKFKSYVDVQNRAARIFNLKMGFKKECLLKCENKIDGKVSDMWLYSYIKEEKCRQED